MFYVDIDDGGLVQRLEAIAIRAGAIPEDTMRSIGEILIAHRQKDFDEGGRPAWKPNLEGTTTMVKSGALSRRAEITSIDGTHVEVTIGEGLPYSFLHQFGGTYPVTETQRKFFWAKYAETGQERWKYMALAKQLTWPARRHARFPDEAVAEITALLSGSVLEGTERFSTEIS